MSSRLTKEDCINLIREKTQELKRLPKKSDFDIETASMIKSYFGPWPRALESAGVKGSDPEKLRQKREKRLRARENQIKYRKEHPKNKEDSK